MRKPRKITETLTALRVKKVEAVRVNAAFIESRLVLNVANEMVDNYSEAWRAECEAVALLKLPLAQRRELLEGIGKKRGIKAREKVEAELSRVWRIQKGLPPQVKP